MGLSRRTWTQSLLGLAAATGSAHAARRPVYGGQLRVSWPFAKPDLTRPHSTSSVLLASALAEPLYGRTPDGRYYPALARALPEERDGRVHLLLREDLEFSDGSLATANEFKGLLEERRKASPHITDLPEARSEGTLGLSFAGVAPSELMRMLALSSFHLGPRGSRSLGAFFLEQSAMEITLKRNKRAPRGGSFLDRVALKRGAVGDGLRDFEVRAADVSWFGRGLHVPRADSSEVTLSGCGLLLLLGGKGLGAFGAPGVLQSLLNRGLPPALLDLGVGSTLPPYSAPPEFPRRLSLLVESDDPYLAELGLALAESWSRPGQTHELITCDAPELDVRCKSRDFDLCLRLVSTRGLSPRELETLLMVLDGQRPHSPQRISSSDVSTLARRLHLGVLGEWRPRIAMGPKVLGLIRSGAPSFENAEYGT